MPRSDELLKIPGFTDIPDISKLVETPGTVSQFVHTEVLTIDELAAYWGVTSASIRSAACKGDIPGCVEVWGKYVFEKETVLDQWVPPKIQSWAQDLNTPIAGDSGLEIEGGRKAIRDATIARLHDLHVLVSPARWAKIIITAVDQAVQGDWRARKWLGDYLMGPPIKRVEAEVEVKTSLSYTDEMRARAIEALLGQAEGRTIVDVPSRQVKDPNAGGKGPT